MSDICTTTTSVVVLPPSLLLFFLSFVLSVTLHGFFPSSCLLHLASRFFDLHPSPAQPSHHLHEFRSKRRGRILETKSATRSQLQPDENRKPLAMIQLCQRPFPIIATPCYSHSPHSPALQRLRLSSSASLVQRKCQDPDPFLLLA